MPIFSDDEAKAAQEIAKFGQNSLDNLSKAGRYLTGTFRGAIGFLASAAEDSAHGFWIRNRAAVNSKTVARLRELGIQDEYCPIGERNEGLLLEAVSLESDENLQEIWSAYISNAMDPSQPGVSIDRYLIRVIKDLEPSDFPVIQRLSYEDLAIPRRSEIRLRVDDFSVGDGHLVTSLSRLAAIGLFTFKNSGSVGFAAQEGWEKPCQLEVETSIGNFRALPLLLVFQRYIRTKEMTSYPPAAK